MLQLEIVEDVVCGVLREPVVRWSIVFLLVASTVATVRSIRQIRDDLDNAHEAGELHIAGDRLVSIDGVVGLVEATWMVLLFLVLGTFLIVLGVDPTCL